MSDQRDLTISWLESNQSNGAFEGFPEDSMDFKRLDNEELKWYHDNWVKSDVDVED